MSVAIRIKMIEIFRLSAIGLILGNRIIRCHLRHNKTLPGLRPLEISVTDCDEPTDTSSDDEEIRAFGKDVAELLSQLDDE
jgi:hypothetical protein